MQSLDHVLYKFKTHVQHSLNGRLLVACRVMVELEMAVFVVLVSALYQWPYLRSACWKVFRWLLALTMICSTLFLLAAVMDSVESIAVEGSLYQAAATRDLTRASELLEYQHVRNEVRNTAGAGRQVGPFGMISSRTPLFKAAAKGHTEMVAVLLKAGANPNAPSRTLGLGMLASQTPLDTATAAARGHTETVAALLKAGANPNIRMTLGLGLILSWTPVDSAVVNGHTETVAALLNAGANPNAPGGTLGLGVVGCRTPLDVAAAKGHTELVAMLLKAGAHPNVPGATVGLGMLISWTPLDSAAKSGRTETVAALLKAGANPNTREMFGLGMLGSRSPLYAAASKGHTETVAALLRAGANPNAPGVTLLGMFSRTPLETAVNEGHHAVADLLRDA